MSNVKFIFTKHASTSILSSLDDVLVSANVVLIATLESKTFNILVSISTNNLESYHLQHVDAF